MRLRWSTPAVRCGCGGGKLSWVAVRCGCGGADHDCGAVAVAKFQKSPKSGHVASLLQHGFFLLHILSLAFKNDRKLSPLGGLGFIFALYNS